MQRLGLEIRHYEAILALAEELSYTRAARRIGITQPGLTRRIQDAEHRLGHILFKRNRANVELTEVGYAFVAEARLAMEHEQRAVHVSHTTAIGVDAGLTIGKSQYADPILVELLLSTHLPLHPNLNVDLISEFAPELAHGVLTGRLDLALIASPDPNPRLSSTKVLELPMHCLIADNDQRLALPSCTLEDFHDCRWVVFDRRVHPALYGTLFDLARGLGIKPRMLHHVMSAEEAAYLVARGGSVAFLSKAGGMRVSRNGLACRPLKHPELNLSTHLVARADNGSKLVSEFARAYMKRAKAILETPQMHLLDALE